MKTLLNTIKEVVKDLKRKTITLTLVTKNNGVVIARDTTKIEKNNIKEISLRDNQIVIEYIPSYKSKRGLQDTVKIGFSLENEDYMILETLKDGRTNLNITDNNKINDLSESEVAATQKNNNTMEVENMNKMDIKINIEDVKEYFETLEFLIQKHAADELDVDGSEIRLFKDNKFIQTSDINTKRILNHEELTLLYQYIINNTNIKINILTNNFNMDSINEIQEDENMEKYNGENILIDDTLKTYLNFKPLHFILLSQNINDDNFKKVDKLINTIEYKIKVGDMFLYKVKKEILTDIKSGVYNGTINKVNTMYNTNIDCIEVYNNIMNDFNYSYNLNNNIIEDNKINISSSKNDNLNMDLQLLARKEPYNQDVRNNCKEVLKETEDYILFKRNNMYILRYFDECMTHEKYNRNKKITQSRITKHYDNIKHLLE